VVLLDQLVDYSPHYAREYQFGDTALRDIFIEKPGGRLIAGECRYG